MSAPGLDPSTAPRETIRELDAEIAALRDDLAIFITELDRRRHELLALRTRVRHRGRQTLLAITVLAGAGSAIVRILARVRRS